MKLDITKEELLELTDEQLNQKVIELNEKYCKNFKFQSENRKQKVEELNNFLDVIRYYQNNENELIM